MKSKIIVGTISLIAISTVSIAFGQTQVPNTFQSGQPARAADVNANFDALEVAIEANTAAISSSGRSIQIISSGSSIGLLVREASTRNGLYGYRGLSDTGYIFDVIAAIDDSELSSSDPPAEVGDLYTLVVWFVGASCTGDTYTNRTNRFSILDFQQGLVFRSDDAADPIQTYFTPSGTQEVSIALASRRSSLEGGCVPVGSAPPNNFTLVAPNDPTTTGVPSDQFSSPVLLLSR